MRAYKADFMLAILRFGWIFLLLVGCAALPGPAPRPSTFDLGPSPTGAAATAKPQAEPPLALATPDAAPAYETTAMRYRYDGGAAAYELHAYAQARWNATPAQLVGVRLRERLALDRPVVAPGEASAPRLLRVQIEDFSQVFAAAPAGPGTASRGVVRLRATLTDTTGPRPKLLAQRLFEAERPAPSADAAGGVQALTAATDAALESLAQWLREAPVAP